MEHTNWLNSIFVHTHPGYFSSHQELLSGNGLRRLSNIVSDIKMKRKRSLLNHFNYPKKMSSYTLASTAHAYIEKLSYKIRFRRWETYAKKCEPEIHLDRNQIKDIK